MRAIILSVGDELILGQTVDTNSAWLSARLAERGVMTLYHQTVADDAAATVTALQRAVAEAELVVVTGGLGPTADDLTRQALAELTGKPLELHAPSLDVIRKFFQSLGREMPASNAVQAHFPQGAEVLDNEWGTAPGVRLRVGKATVVALPGVPSEMEQMAARYILPLYGQETGSQVEIASLATFGAGESTVAELLGELMRRDGNPLVGTTVSGGVVTVRLRCEAATRELARATMAETLEVVRQRLGKLVFSEDGRSLAVVVGQLAKERGLRLVTAESCTGGLVAKMLTDIAGSSAWFEGGWVTYANAMKMRCLGVPEALIEREGAVSEAVACAMATGALEQSTADFSVALTGVAGPDGGTADKPVGMVWIAVGHRQGGRVVANAVCGRFPGDREMIRDRAAKTALNLFRLNIAMGSPFDGGNSDRSGRQKD